MDFDRTLSAYDYGLPAHCIAQNPAEPRDHAKLFVINHPTSHAHHIFYELDRLLKPGDLLVLNNTKVIPARLYGQKSTGSQVEVLLLEEKSLNRWLALVKPGRKLQPGATIHFTPHNPNAQTSNTQTSNAQTLSAIVCDRDEASGGRILEFTVPEGRSLLEVIDDYGHMPLPPYITESTSENDRYQTVYAETSSHCLLDRLITA